MTLARARDEIALVRDVLLAAASIRDAGIDVRTAHVNAPDLGTVTYPLIILDRTAGNARYNGTLRDLSFDLYGYSNLGQDEASRIYDLAFAALHSQRLVARDRTVMPAAGYVREIDRPEPGYNDVTRSWYARGTWVAYVVG